MNKSIILFIAIALLATGCGRSTDAQPDQVVAPAAAMEAVVPTASIVAPAALEFKTESPDPAYAGSSTVWEPTTLTNKQLKGARARYNEDRTGLENNHDAVIELEFTPEGRDIFARLTKENIGKRIGIFVDGELVNAPTVQASITDGIAIIVGDYTSQQAEDLAARLNASIPKS